ncbi:MAG: flagellar brake protein [Aeromicrobium sp.]|nr:flagellar brake protein [Burkholderiales bacterium]
MKVEPIHPEEENQDEQFRVTSRAEVITILRALAADNVLVTVFFGGPDNFAVTRLLAVNPQYEEIIFDGVSNAASKNAMRYATSLSVHAFHKHIKVTFDSLDVEPTLFENQPAFRMRLPSSVIRLQRRSDYRAKAPVLTAATIGVCKEGLNEPLKTRLSDISCGGLSFSAPREKVAFSSGDVFLGCKLEMPQIGTIEVSIEIRHVSRYRDGAGRAMQRYGCKFLRITGASTTLVQRYINQIDVDRRKSVGHL